MNMIEQLEQLGANTQEALQRFSGNSALYTRMLGKFTSAVKDLEVMKFIDSKDKEQAVSNAHTLKGITGNLSLKPLFDGYTDIVNSLRADDPDTAKSRLEQILPIQEKIIACIEANLN